MELFFAMVGVRASKEDRKIAGKEGGEEERKRNQLFFSLKMKSDNDEKNLKRGRKERD